MNSYLYRCALVLFAALFSYTPVAWSEVVQLEDISFASLPGDAFEVKLVFAKAPPEPTGYTMENPARIVVDLPGVESVLEEKKHQLSFENARSAVVISAGDKTRLILNMTAMAPYKTIVNGREMMLVVGSPEAGKVVTKTSAIAASKTTSSISKRSQSEVTGVDFQRGEAGEGMVTIKLSDPSVSADVQQVGGDIQLSFFRTELPQRFDRRLDVVDFATPVKEIDTSYDGSTTVVKIEAVGEYDYLAYQADNQYVVSVKPLTEKAIAERQKRFAFVGEKLSLNFQDIEVRSVLQLIADFTDLNLVASDTVSGKITLRLNDVPWDQALEIVLKAKGLDKRQEGNVLLVAPAAEIAERERLQVEANKQLQELAPLRTEFIRVSYADATELFELFDSEGSGEGDGDSGTSTASILSERGSAIVDERTNTIILTDTEDKILEFRRLVAEIDIPIPQVLIEARIVIANTDFRKELGARASFQGGWEVGDDNLLGTTGSLEALESPNNPLEIFKGAGADGGTILVNDSALGVDLGVPNPAGSFALELLTSNVFIDLELSALENSGYGEIISQPKVLTGDKQNAIIRAGSEVPYTTVSDDGANTEFKEVALKLDVTPQITPDKRVILDLIITQDSVGDQVSGGEPIIDITSIETQALVGDGQTLVLGGLYREESFNLEEKVPLLGDIPVLGKLFRHTTNSNQKREILIFITPKIVDNSLLDS